MSTSTIDLKIDTAFKKSEALYNSKLSWQEETDNLLDRMNALGKHLTSLHSLLLNLTFELERDMEGFKKSKVGPISIKKIVTASTKMLNVVRKSDLYPGVKTTHHLLKQEVSYLNELAHDRTIGLELDGDYEMKELIKTTIDAARRK